MMTEPENLKHVFDSAMADISHARESFTPQLKPREVGTITSIATGIAKVSGLLKEYYEDKSVDFNTGTAHMVLGGISAIY